MKAMIQISMMVAMVSMTVACSEKEFDSTPIELQSTAAPGLDGSNGFSVIPPSTSSGGVSTGGNTNGNTAGTGSSTPVSVIPQPAPMPGIEQFVAALYENLFQRRQETAGYIFWSAEYRRGTVSCSSITMAFLRSNEAASIRNRADNSPQDRAQYIQLSYLSVLGRYPDQPGFDFWLTAMNGGLGAGELERALVDSAEFRARCQSYGLRY